MTNGVEGFRCYLACEQKRQREYEAVKDMFPGLELLYGLMPGSKV